MPPLHLTSKFLVMILAAFLLPAMASAKKTLRYSDHEPLGGMRTKFIKDVFFAAIEKESNGRLKIADHWDSALATGYDALSVLGEGAVADIGIVVPEYKSDKLPLHQIFKGFPVGPTGDNQVKFFRRVYADIPAFPAELAKNNVVNILFTTGYPVAFFSTKPLNTLEDIKGEKWRTASFWHKDFLANAGATPVTIRWGAEVFNALKAKTLDGLMVNVDSGYMLKVHEAAPNVLASKDLWLGHVYLLVMNRKTWDGLPKEDREAIQRAAEIAYKALGSVMDSSFDAMVSDIKKEGVKIRLLKDTEVAAFKTATKYQDVQAAWVKEQEGKGVKDVGPTLEKVSAILNDAMK
jgi:TRAP-type C4-dicarboxylate transport system substrate-binding protein